MEGPLTVREARPQDVAGRRAPLFLPPVNCLLVPSPFPDLLWWMIVETSDPNTLFKS